MLALNILQFLAKTTLGFFKLGHQKFVSYCSFLQTQVKKYVLCCKGGFGARRAALTGTNGIASGLSALVLKSCGI